MSYHEDIPENLREAVRGRLEHETSYDGGHLRHLISVSGSWIVNEAITLAEVSEDTVEDLRFLAQLWHEAVEDPDLVAWESDRVLAELSDAVDDDEVLAAWIHSEALGAGPSRAVGIVLRGVRPSRHPEENRHG